ncbi:hypothetical protein SUGI_0192380 [Cryptomeria japonica]|uniref:galactinol synthase 4-like n=1 Tax=Cryptomeria japonica TaxID=3369 RepID=UPI002408AF5E|nr:galactinol synthase 4-like [Cryptomeria japonica]GLJ12510.1 hypothetical protein SUGI_0192380 [Cryptomeria japonica]
MAPQVPVEFVGEKAETIPNYAYVTFLAGNGDHVKGVIGLVKGLRKVGSAYNFVVAVLPDVPPEHWKLLSNQGCIVIEIKCISPPENQVQFAMAHNVTDYSKLGIWELEEYSKMIYLDVDIQVYDNIDHLFHLANGHFYAVPNCFCEETRSHTPQYAIGYCPEKIQWPFELGHPPALYFNTGMFVFEPSKLTYKTLLNTLENTPHTPSPEQVFLNMFFQKVYRPLPLLYNLALPMLWRHPENVELDKVKVVQYCADGSKPWRYKGKKENMEREDVKMLVKKWWEIYNDPTLDFKWTD